MPLSYCDQPGCSGLAKTGKFCPAHKENNYQRDRVAMRPDLDRWYKRAAWCGSYGVRGYKLRRDPMCEVTNCQELATDVHHKDDSWKETGDWSLFIGGVNMSNLQSLCHGHHSKITLEANRKRGVL